LLTPKSWSSYVGLNPAFDHSGQSQWNGGIGGHGRKDLRAVLIEGAQSILRSSKTALALWGKRLLARKGQINLVVAAIARKLTVALWYLMMGRYTPLVQIDERLVRKVGRMISSVGQPGLQRLGKTRQAYRQDIYHTLKTGPIYVLDLNQKYTPKSQTQSATTLAQEYGLR
jgi:hypothetical protein